jgi:hypothetical protein
MLNPAPAASPTDEEEYPQANRGRRKANNQKDSSNGTLVVEEPMAYEHTDVISSITALRKAYWLLMPVRLSAFRVGFATTSVKVIAPPLPKVDVKVEVISEGAYEVDCPRLLVV